MSRGEGTRFASWKDIAAYLDHDIRTVRRWEKTRGLPVYRVPGGGRASVYAYQHEIDAWLRESGGGNGDATRPAGNHLAATADSPSPSITSPAKRWLPLSFRPRRLFVVSTGIVLSVIPISFLLPRLIAFVETLTPKSFDIAPGAPHSDATNGLALIRKGENFLTLHDGKLYLFGMVTDGAAFTAPFSTGQYVTATNAAGNLAASIAYGTGGTGNFTTRTKNHVIGGVSVSGSWDTFDVFSAANRQPGASSASVNFTLASDSLVLIIGLAAGQQYLSINGLQEFHTDAWSSGAGTEAMIIGHEYLRAGTYTVYENSSAAVARNPGNMVDLIGVYAFGSGSGRAPKKSGSAPPPKVSLRIASEDECLGTGPAISGVRGFGTIRVVSGDGAFSAVTTTHKFVSVKPAARLAGSVTLQTVDLGPAFADTPLIETPTWGDHATSWRKIGNLYPGRSVITTPIDLRSPYQPGTYHLVFAFNMEMNGGDVASATNWARGEDVWYDGNDIAEFDASRLSDAQQFGCAIGSGLSVQGYNLMYIPADAITVSVD